MPKILFMCVANSARSQIAEGLAKQIFGDKAWIESAGSVPKSVNSLAVDSMKEIGIDLSKHYSKSFEQLKPGFIVDLNYIITLCAEEVCPVMASRTAQKIHWPMPDPAGHDDLSYEERLQLFRNTRDEIKAKLITFKAELRI